MPSRNSSGTRYETGIERKWNCSRKYFSCFGLPYQTERVASKRDFLNATQAFSTLSFDILMRKIKLSPRSKPSHAILLVTGMEEVEKMKIWLYNIMSMWCIARIIYIVIFSTEASGRRTKDAYITAALWKLLHKMMLQMSSSMELTRKSQITHRPPETKL